MPSHITLDDLDTLAQAVKLSEDGPYLAAERLVAWLRHHPASQAKVALICWAHGVQTGAMAEAMNYDRADITEEVPRYAVAQLVSGYKYRTGSV